MKNKLPKKYWVKGKSKYRNYRIAEENRDFWQNKFEEAREARLKQENKIYKKIFRFFVDIVKKKF